MTRTMFDVEPDAFTLAYIEAALWSSNDESRPDGGDPLDSHYGIKDLADETLDAMIADCERFQREHAADIDSDVERAGHDFWLTRNHHGCGFWDGDWPEEIGERLTVASHGYGESTLYVGDDGRVYA